MMSTLAVGIARESDYRERLATDNALYTDLLRS